ncbi:MAG: glycosyltransferase family 1 protein [Opitutaceae bacterium]
MKPLRILYDFEAFSDQSYGGVSRYIIELASRLAKADEIEVHLAAGWHRNHWLKTHLPEWASGRYFPAWPKTGEIRRRLNAILMRRAISRIRPDIVHRTYHRGAAVYPGPHATVATIHDLTYYLYPESFPGGAVVRQKLTTVAQTSDHLLCDSENTRQDAIRILGIEPSIASVVHLGVNPTITSIDPSPIDGDYLLFVGQRSGYKNFTFLIRALARYRMLESRRLAVFGGGPFKQDERILLKSLGIASRVVSLAGDDSILAATYAHAEALVYPSLYEGFGLPILEAMAQGCPVVCSDRSSLPEVGGNAAVYFDPEDDGDSLRKAIDCLDNSPHTREEFVSRGRNRVRLFNWSNCATKTLKVYRDVASELRDNQQ